MRQAAAAARASGTTSWIKVLAEFGVRGELCVADTEIGSDRIETQSILPRAKLNLRHTLATQSLVGQQRRRDGRCVHLGQDHCERHAVLDRLVGPLTQMRQHRMCRVAEQRQPPFGPGR